MNPLSEDLNVMRQTLLFGGLETLRRNINHRMANLRLFEFGNCYSFREEERRQEESLSGYRESTHVALWLSGKWIEGTWAHPNEDTSFFQLKAVLLNIFARLGLSPAALKMETVENDVYASALRITHGGLGELGSLGVIQPSLAQRAGVSQTVYYAELDWTLLMRATRKHQVEYTEISKYPAVSRDLALLVDRGVSFYQIEALAYATERKLLKKVELFDVYEGRNLPEGKKSYAVNFLLQDEGRTLNDKQIDKTMQNLIRRFQTELGAQLR